MDVREFLRNQILLMNGSSLNLSEKVDKVYSNLTSYYTIPLNENDLKSKISGFFGHDSDSKINVDSIVDNFVNEVGIDNILYRDSNDNFSKEKELDSKNDKSGSQEKYINVNNLSSNTSSSGLNQIIDLIDNVLMDIAQSYKLSQSIFLDNNIKASGYVATEFSPFYADLKKKETESLKWFDKASNGIVYTMNSLGATDDSVVANLDNSSYDFNEVIYMLELIKGGSKIKKADKSFFESCPNAKITEYKDDNGNMQFKVTCEGYTYDSKGSKLIDSNGKSIAVHYFVPSNYSDVSKLNTLTALSGAGELSVMEYKEQGIISTNSNSIIIMPSKPSGGEDSSYFNIKDEVVSSTLFMNKITNQREECQNIISGCSAGGCSALKIAAFSGDTYDTALCINNACLVGGENANVGTKEQFASLSDLQKLDGKNIYFISSKGDPNLDHMANSSSGWAECGNVSKSYLYTGVDLTAKNCPNSKIYLITNSSYSGFETLAGKYGNLEFSQELWKQMFGDSNYNGHADYKKMLTGLMNNGFIDYNIYTDLSI